jgi:hypothetical protein
VGGNSFWEFVILDGEAQTSRTDKEKETLPLSVQEKELETIFCSLKTSNAALSTVGNAHDDEHFEDVDAPSTDPVDLVETEVEWIAALKKLSQVKKYFLNPLALKDLNVVGWEMLVQNLKETRLKQRDE